MHKLDEKELLKASVIVLKRQLEKQETLNKELSDNATAVINDYNEKVKYIMNLERELKELKKYKEITEEIRFIVREI